MINMTNIYKTYSGTTQKTRVLNNVSLNIAEGEFVTLVGPSGSGKSTLLYIAGGLEPPTKGSVLVNNKDLFSLNDKQLSESKRKDIGFVFQFFNLLPNLSVLDNIALPAILDGRKSKESRDSGMQYLEKMQLKDKADRLPNELSGGEQQRIAIARALICNPKVILADEPTGNLDSESSQIVLELFREINLKDNKTILMVTHSKDSIQYSSRTVTLQDGVVVS